MPDTSRPLDRIPQATPNIQARRAYAQEVTSGIITRNMAQAVKAARKVNDESMRALVVAAEADGIRLSESSIVRLERGGARSELDMLSAGYIIRGGGYTFEDLYPSGAQ